MTMGLILMLYASFIFGVSTLVKGGWPAFTAFNIGAGLLLPLLGWTMQRLKGWVRSRYLTPRLGYVRHRPREQEPAWHVILFSLGVTGVGFLIFLIFKRWDKWFLLLASLCWGAGRIGFGRHLGVRRFVLTGILCALLG